MKRQSLLVLIVIVMLMIFSFQIVSANTVADYSKEAEKLKSMELFNGTEKGFELERVPKRVEAAAMLVRLLGAENEANSNNYKHPFDDVPEWANAAVGYLYEKGLTKGISENKFGSDKDTDLKDYATFMLRTLKYDDADFSWEKSVDFSVEKGIITADESSIFKNQTFRRNEMALISYRTLKAEIKGEKLQLSNSLVNSGAINAQSALDAGVAEYDVLSIKIKPGYKYDVYFSRLKPELREKFYKIISTDGKADLYDRDFLAKYTLIPDFEKKEHGMKFNGNKNQEDMLNEYYFVDEKSVAIFLDENFIMTYYAIIPTNPAVGEYNIVVQPVDDELRELILKYEDELGKYIAEESKKIQKISSNAYKLEKGEEGKLMLKIKRENLPANIRNFVYLGQSGESDKNSLDRIINIKLKGYYSRLSAYRGDEEPYSDEDGVEVRYDGCTSLTLFDENRNLLGIAILNIN